MYIRGAHVARPSLVRWDSSSPETPFLLASRVMPGCTLKVWRTDGYGGPIPPSDYQLLTQTAFAFGQVHHIRNHHAYGYTRYDVTVLRGTLRLEQDAYVAV